MPGFSSFPADYDALIPKPNGDVTQNYVPLSYILKYQNTANDNMVSEIKEETALMFKQATARQIVNKTRVPMQVHTQNRKCHGDLAIAHIQNFPF